MTYTSFKANDQSVQGVIARIILLKINGLRLIFGINLNGYSIS